jgi:cytochrome c-type biogenesis protein CcsB
MGKIVKYLFSMQLMALGLFAFFAAIACATFIENDFGTPVAQKWVYKSWWFGSIIGYLALCLIANMFRYRMFQLKKIGLLVFHLAFLVIIAGALCTRLVGFEGAMEIREGQSSNEIISADTYVQIKAHDFNVQYMYDLPLILDTNEYEKDENGKTDFSHNYFEHEFDFPEQQQPVKIEFLDLIKNIRDTLIPDENGAEYIEIVTVGQSGRQYNFLQSGEILEDGGFKIAFNNDTAGTDAVKISATDSGMFVMSPYDLGYFQMADSTSGIIARDSLQPFQIRRLYSYNGIQFVFSRYLAKAKIDFVSATGPQTGLDGIKVRVSQGDLQTEVVLRGGKSIYPRKEKFTLGGLNYELAWGSKVIQLPFSVFLRDFQIEYYPGTQNPSSYASYVTVIDHATGTTADHHIYMNNVMDYGGYRFFQSSYKGDRITILSVNHDALGTAITYIGYLLLAIGFLINLFSPASRFMTLAIKFGQVHEKRLTLKTIALLAGLSVASVSNSQVTDKIIDYDHAEAFGRLVIQDFNGRFQPVHTLALDLLRKIHRNDTYEGQTPMQVFLGVHTNNEWNLEPIIAVPGEEIRKKLNLPEGEKYACLQDFITMDLGYVLFEDVRAAQMKREALRNEHDKNILKVDERFNIMLGLFTGFYLKIFPLANDSTNTWYSPYDPAAPFPAEDAEFIGLLMQGYGYAVQQSYQTGDWSEPGLVIQAIDKYQQRVADPSIMPGDAKIEWEIRYNKANIFKHLTKIYIYLGLLLLVLAFIQVFVPRFSMKWPLRIAAWLVGAAFILHGSALGLRWYLSGHAPWSNGYEAVVFIAFVTIFAGLLLHRRNSVILGAACILAWLTLFVAGMSQLDPQITNLVPVLKSYWLQIHVSVITGSYAFLGLGAILGLITLCIYVFASSENRTRISLLSKELTYVSEMTIIIGLFMLTIGTFLGGVWANESWGRYWGWDAKETWALASVLMYSIILHLRFVPGLNRQFTFNTFSLWGYSSIIMTFFGVNFYLSGLHSYAQGDPIPIPTWVPVTIISLAALNIVSYIRYRKVFKNTDGEHS